MNKYDIERSHEQLETAVANCGATAERTAAAFSEFIEAYRRADVETSVPYEGGLDGVDDFTASEN